MKILEGLKFIFSSSRGIGKIFSRLKTIRERFGFTPDKQIEYISYYASLLKEYDLKATFFIPAKVLDKYKKEIKNIGSDNIEWGIHGYTHTDLSRLGLEVQVEQLKKAIGIFDSCGIKFSGFRAPYLRFNSDTIKAVLGIKRFVYDSSRSIIWDEIYVNSRKYFRWLSKFYHPLFHSTQAALPQEINKGIIEIPVTLPDDDTLIDREKLSDKDAYLLWSKILKAAHEKNEIFVLQLHPERIHVLKVALKEIICEAKSLQPKVWITTLSEVAQWQNSKQREQKRWPESFQGVFCITGDIDSITVMDFLQRLKEW